MKKLLGLLTFVLLVSFANGQTLDNAQIDALQIDTQTDIYQAVPYDEIFIKNAVKKTIYEMRLIVYLRKKNILTLEKNTIACINGSVFVNHRRVRVPKSLTKKLDNFEIRNFSKE